MRHDEASLEVREAFVKIAFWNSGNPLHTGSLIADEGSRMGASSSQTLQVLVVDDSAFMRKAITLMIESDPAFKVVDVARNGEEALTKMQSLQPDLVTLDIEMPIMDGMSVLRKVKERADPNGPAILVCSTLTTQGSHDALMAMRLGAADFITKDPGAIGAADSEIRKDLMHKLKAIGESRSRRVASQRATRATKPAVPLPPLPALSHRPVSVVVIGSSTGGPPVLEEVLRALPKSFPAPVVVAQHMPMVFTASLAERLSHLCQVSVKHGEHGQKLQPGVASVIPGGQHGRVVRGLLGELRLEVSQRPLEAVYKPSVTELFASAARVVGGAAVGVMLTGMGDDGAAGSKELHDAGAPILAQNAETCVVYGMPRAVVERGLATPATPEQIGQALRCIRLGRAESPVRESA
jgi:two-component system chemotaxis response regulator CheB